MKLRRSALLEEIDDVTETESDEELAAWRQRPDESGICKIVRMQFWPLRADLINRSKISLTLTGSCGTTPNGMEVIARAYRDFGYLDLWRHEQRIEMQLCK